MAIFDKIKYNNGTGESASYLFKEGINRLITCNSAKAATTKVINFNDIEPNYQLKIGDTFYIKFTLLFNWLLFIFVVFRCCRLRLRCRL